MIKEIINGIVYRLPGSLNKKGKVAGGLTKFQKEMYVHLINWKWKKNIEEPGIYQKKDKNGIVQTYEYDAILPKSVHKNYPLIYPSILNDLQEHRKKYYFKFHQHFNHMASSQAANVNLFLPILLHPRANEILRLLKKPDFKRLATSELYKGFRIEYWDGNSDKETGLLNDHSALSGTDADIAIAYYNHEDELCLWLIEHKLTEKEFSECGGYKSVRNKTKSQCNHSFSDILQNKALCYHVHSSNREYWNITEDFQSFFTNATNHSTCPFKGGMNQLWRNQLMGLALEKAGKFKEVYFSVVKHQDNQALDGSINEYKKLINNHSKFSVFNSNDVIQAASILNDSELNKWIDWYKGLYKI